MKCISWIALGAGILAANGAAAQSSTNGFYINGYAELSYSSDGNGQTMARTELDLGFAPDAGISGAPIGFSLGVDAFSLENNVDEIALYPALTFNIGANSLVSVGIPRSVYDAGYIPKTNLAKNSLFDLQFSGIKDSFLAFNYLIGDFDLYGIRYDGTFDNTKVGVSYHRVDSDLDYYALAFSHEFTTVGSFPSVMVFGGIEHTTVGGGNFRNYRLGVEGRNDKLNVGLILSDVDSAGSTKIAELYGGYNFTDNLSALASILHFEIGGSSETSYGIGLEYSFLNNGYVDASVVGGSSGFDTAYEISVGWRF